MELYDISRGLLFSPVYPGDPAPEIKKINSLDNDDYELSSLFITTHTATHIDAPSHMIEGGIAVDKIPLYKTVGQAIVMSYDGVIDKENAEGILSRSIGGEFSKRILIKGKVEFTVAGACAFADAGIFLIGVEGMTIGDLSVHRAFLEKEVVILENIDLQGVNDGYYFLSAMPLLIEGGDGAPCRAILHKI